jgi:hypothetical protein
VNRHNLRHYPRQRCGILVQYGFLEEGAPFLVRMTDISENGMGIVSGYELRPGDKIRITDRKSDEEPSAAGLCTAEVVWCRPLDEEPAYSYRAGIRFDENRRSGACRPFKDAATECRLP